MEPLSLFMSASEHGTVSQTPCFSAAPYSSVSAITPNRDSIPIATFSTAYLLLFSIDIPTKAFMIPRPRSRLNLHAAVVSLVSTVPILTHLLYVDCFGF